MSLTNDRRKIASLGLLAILLMLPFFTTGAGSAPGDTCTVSNGSCDKKAIGTWYNMPAATTELFGNTTNEVYCCPGTNVQGARVTVFLGVTVLQESIQGAAYLAIQYMNVSNINNGIPNEGAGTVSQGPWIEIVSHSEIDGSVGCVSGSPPCTVVSGPFTLPIQQFTGNGWEFRVIGNGGGGAGDNPRFGNILIYESPVINGVTVARASGITRTSFLATVTASLPMTTASYVASFNYIATNSTSLLSLVESGTGTCTIPIGGSSCSQTKTFGTAFLVGQTPAVVVTMTSGNVPVGTPITGALPVFAPQSVTV